MADADGGCTAITSVPPIIEWYSRCAASPFTSGGAQALEASGPVEPTYIVFSSIDERRASAGTLQRYRAILEVRNATGIAIESEPSEVEVDRLTRP